MTEKNKEWHEQASVQAEEAFRMLENQGIAVVVDVLAEDEAQATNRLDEDFFEALEARKDLDTGLFSRD